MNAYVISRDRNEIRVEADPRCGEDFCDRCGDCLHCYVEDACGGDGGDHIWVVYAGQTVAFYAHRPELAARHRARGGEVTSTTVDACPRTEQTL